MTTLFSYLQDATPIPVSQKQTVIWNGVKYENPLFDGFKTEFSFNKERSELKIEITCLFQDESGEPNERHLGKFVINLDQLSSIYGAPKDKLLTIFREKIVLLLPPKEYDDQWLADLTNFLMEKHQNWGDEWAIIKTNFRFISPFTETNIDTIIQEFMGSLIEFGCR